MKTIILFFSALFAFAGITAAQQDPYQWLEEVDAKRSLDFVNGLNKTTVDKLSTVKEYESIYKKTLEISNSSERIAYPSVIGKYVYNFWRDKDHERGIWRRTLLAAYNAGKPDWETVIDIDALSKQDNIKWVYKGVSGLYPDYKRFLVQLSKGGGDAVVIKEFDAEKKQFIEDGFSIPEAKGGASYLDANTLIVSSNFGEGTTTSSGYARQVKIWKRGSLLKDAPVVFEGETSDVSVGGGLLRDGDKAYTFFRRGISTFSAQYFIRMNEKNITLDLPKDVGMNGLLNDQLIIQLKSDWKPNTQTYTAGTLLSLNFTELLKGNKQIAVITKPDQFSSVASVASTKNYLLVNMLSNVTGQLYVYTFSNNKWTGKKVKAPELGTISIVDTDDFSDQFFFSYANFVTPTTLYTADAATNTSKPVKSLPAFFDGSKYEVKQWKARSKDGTMVPYFVVAKKNVPTDGKNPTLVYAYGGFDISTNPFYAPAYGIGWLENGGVLVVANIRGGGEFGPKWHLDGIKEKRQNVFDDLYAVSEDLINRKITSSQHLGVMGGSNGGLLVGVAFTQRPDLYNAVMCEVPLLDMQRYNKLLAGASWMGEYGNPDIPEEWAYISKYSPYQNVKAGMKYPEVFFTTSTRDDRVHPGHARKMAAKMKDMGYNIYYYENTEGGHAGSSTNEQSAKINALRFSYLLMKLR